MTDIEALLEALTEAHDNFAALSGVSNEDLSAVLDAAYTIERLRSGGVGVPEGLAEAIYNSVKPLLEEQSEPAVEDYVDAIRRALSVAPPPPVSGAGEPVIKALKEARQYIDGSMLADEADILSQLDEAMEDAVTPPESINAEMLEALREIEGKLTRHAAAALAGASKVPPEQKTIYECFALQAQAFASEAQEAIAKATAGKAAEPEAGR